jgi:MreB/Mrl family cell shape determining protein
MTKQIGWKQKFLTIAIGQTISLIGSSAVQFSLIWWLASETESPMVMALSGLFAFLPQLFLGPFAGVWVDRLKRKYVVIAADLFIGLMAIIIAIYYYLVGNPPYWTVCVILGIRAIGNVFHTPAIQAIVPMLVPKEELIKANGWSQFMQSGAFMLGPVFGAAMYAALPMWLILLTDFIGAVVASICVAVVKIPEVKKSQTEIPRFLAEMKEGAIADFETTRRMLKYFIEKTLGINKVFKPRVIISVPFGTTQVEKRAVIEAAVQGGAKDVFLIEEPLAAAIGAGLHVQEPIGNMIVNIGGGTTEIAVIALGGIVKGVSVRSGGDALNYAIMDYLRKNYRIEIGERTAENIKFQIGHASSPMSENSLEIKGINLRNSLPTALELSSSEITKAMEEPLANMLSGIKRIYENTPPQLASDIIETGITLTGGGALLKNIDELISQEMNLPVIIAEDPMDCVALGTGKIISQMKTLTRLALYHR